MSTPVRIVLVGEAYGAQEAQAKAPFVGPTGSLLNRLCQEAGLITAQEHKGIETALWARDYPRRDQLYARAGIRLTNVFNLQPPSNKIEALCGPKHDKRRPIRAGKYLRPEYYGELDRLKTELEEWQPNITIGLGATALWFATGYGAITKTRGTIIDSMLGKFLATYHPAYLLRGAWSMRPILVSDLTKAHKHSIDRAVVRPPRTIYVPETLDDIAEAFEWLKDASTIAIDIETAQEQITCIGFAPSKARTLVIPIWDSTKLDNSYWMEYDEQRVWEWIRAICALPAAKVFQNGLYDLHYLWRGYGIAVANCKHDTMLLHHALQPEVQKSLAFLGALYTDEVAWKQMRKHVTTLKHEDE